MNYLRLITTDQGREFNNLLNKEFMKKLNIKHNLATPYHPQSNGLDKRFNQTLQRMLVKFCNSDKTNWDEYLNTCVFAYNTSRYNALFLLFGNYSYVCATNAKNGTIVKYASQFLKMCWKNPLFHGIATTANYLRNYAIMIVYIDYMYKLYIICDSVLCNLIDFTCTSY